MPMDVEWESAREAKPVLICFSHLRWRFVYQRPQHLMSRAAAEWDVHFFEEPLFEHGCTEPRLDFIKVAAGVTVVVPVLPAGTPEARANSILEDAVDQIMDAHRGEITAFWYYTPHAVKFSLRREPDVCIYDCMDELSAFKGAAPDLAELETTLFAISDLVFTGGLSLYEVKNKRHPNVHLFPSSVDKAHFGAARDRAQCEPADQQDIARPRIGFFGVIDERFDIELTARLANLRPDWHFILIGPVVKIDEATLPQRPNLHWLGCKSYEDLPRYLAHWDAGFMPFALNEATRFISPTKTPEFLAAGLPVVASPVRDVVRDWGEAGLVEIARTAEDFADRLDGVLALPRATWRDKVDRRLARLSWDVTWRQMSALIGHELVWRLRWRDLASRLPDETAVDAGNV